MKKCGYDYDGDNKKKQNKEKQETFWYFNFVVLPRNITESVQICNFGSKYKDWCDI